MLRPDWSPTWNAGSVKVEICVLWILRFTKLLSQWQLCCHYLQILPWQVLVTNLGSTCSNGRKTLYCLNMLKWPPKHLSQPKKLANAFALLWTWVRVPDFGATMLVQSDVAWLADSFAAAATDSAPKGFTRSRRGGRWQARCLWSPSSRVLSARNGASAPLGCRDSARHAIWSWSSVCYVCGRPGEEVVESVGACAIGYMGLRRQFVRRFMQPVTWIWNDDPHWGKRRVDDT